MFDRAGIDARFASSNEFASRAPLRAGDGVIVLSHTGETAYARAARQRALDIGAETVSITADGVGWPEAIETGAARALRDLHAQLHAALAVLALIAGELGAEGLGPEAVVAAADATDGRARGARRVPAAGAADRAGRARPRRGHRPRGSAQAARGRPPAGRGLRRRVPAARQRGAARASDDLLIVLGRDADGFLAAACEGRARGGRARRSSSIRPGDELIAQIPLTARLQLLALRRAEAGGHDPDTVIVGPWADETLWATGAP